MVNKDFLFIFYNVVILFNECVFIDFLKCFSILFYLKLLSKDLLVNIYLVSGYSKIVIK